MVILDITNVQPFDVLLTAGDAKLSGLIRAGQHIVRGKPAPFSHAAMFLSPFLMVESLNEPGIVLTNLFEGSLNPHGNSTNSRSNPIFLKTTKPVTRLYLRLDGVSDAEIRRFKPLQGLSTAQKNIYSSNVIDALSTVYLASYPPMVRLLRTANLLPNEVLELLERIGARWEGKNVSGPFCSELVTLLLAAIDPAILSCRPDAAAVAPSDIFHNNDLFDAVPSTVFHDDSDIPGFTIPHIESELKRNIEIDVISQKFNTKIVHLIDTLSRAFSASNGEDSFLYNGEPIEKYYRDLLESQRALWLGDVQSHMSESALVLKWLSDTNACAATCPSNRPPSPNTNGRPRLRLRWEHDGPASEACADVRFCPSSPWTWDRLKSKLEAGKEARLQRDNERSQAYVESMKRER